MAKILTRHNGRAGKSGVYKSTHNDRTFDTEHAGHIGTMEDSVSPDVLLKDEERLYHPKAEEIDYRAGDGD